jgi:hypothetical protein
LVSFDVNSYFYTVMTNGDKLRFLSLSRKENSRPAPGPVVTTLKEYGTAPILQMTKQRQTSCGFQMVTQLVPCGAA